MLWGKCKKKVRVRSGEGGQGGCEPRIELIVKMQKKSREGGGQSGWGGQGGCKPRIEVIVKME